LSHTASRKGGFLIPPQEIQMDYSDCLQDAARELTEQHVAHLKQESDELHSTLRLFQESQDVDNDVYNYFMDQLQNNLKLQRRGWLEGYLSDIENSEGQPRMTFEAFEMPRELWRS